MTTTESTVQHPWFEKRRNEYLRWYPKSLQAFRGLDGWNSRNISGLYIHVPFCDKICRFCPYNKRLTDEALVARYVNALVVEIGLLQERHTGQRLSFVYFGGGTPSVLAGAQVGGILEAVRRRFVIDPDTEVSMEVHPTHATHGRLRDLRSAGVNRVSIGIQSFDDALLKRLGATHPAELSVSALDAATATFENVAIDLLYCYAGQSLADWTTDLRTALDRYYIRHLSCYAVVPINSDFLQPSQAEEIRFAREALDFARAFSLEHYASCASGGFDVASPGRRCHYEFEHWAAPQAEFLGLGPGAFGFSGGHTTANRLSVPDYCASLERGRLPLISLQPVPEDELRHRYFSLGVKTLDVPFDPYREAFGRDPRQDFAEPLSLLVSLGLATVSGSNLRLTDVGRLYVDSCSARFYSAAEAGVPHPEEPEVRALERLAQPIAML